MNPPGRPSVPLGLPFPDRTVLYWGVAWVFLAVSMAFAVLAVNALFPIRREPLTVVSFVLGWVPGELPLQAGAYLLLAPRDAEKRRYRQG